MQRLIGTAEAVPWRASQATKSGERRRHLSVTSTAWNEAWRTPHATMP